MGLCTAVCWGGRGKKITYLLLYGFYFHFLSPKNRFGDILKQHVRLENAPHTNTSTHTYSICFSLKSISKNYKKTRWDEVCRLDEFK